MSRPAFERVLVLSVSAGAGHLRAADAVAAGLKQEGVALAVTHLDILKHSSALMRNLYARTYIKLASVAPDLLGWVYDRSDRPWKFLRRRTAFDRANLGGMIAAVEAARPDLVVCTHFTPAEVCSWLKARGRLRAPLAVVVTDFDAHGMWLVPRVDRYYVALDETKEYLARVHVPAARIRVTGIPIDPVFALNKDRALMRRRHGLHPRHPAIIVSAGGFGVGPVEALLKSLRGLRHPAQVIALCGRNDALRRKLAPLGRAAGAVTFHIMGFTDRMDELMSASDLVLGKPGGLTTSEALAKGLGMVIVNPIPGQEERNADHLLEAGAAIRCNNPPVLAWKLDRLLGDPARLASLRRNARRLGRPHAARTIARDLATLR